MTYHREVNDDDLTERIIGVAFDVYNALGPEHPEQTYRDAMFKGIERDDLDVEVEWSVTVELYGEKYGSRRLDLFVEQEVAVELKTVRELQQRHFDQLATNVRASEATRGLLLNFGADGVGIRRYATRGWLEGDVG